VNSAGESSPARDVSFYTGSWERSGRSLNAAALAGLLGVGVLYSYGQSALATAAIFAQGGTGTTYREGDSLFQWLAERAELAKNPIRFSLICSQLLLMLLPTLWIVRRWHTVHVREYVRLQWLPVRLVLLAALTTAFFFPANAYLSGLLVSALGVPKELIEINEKFLRASSSGEFLLLVVAIAVIPALCEETFFRGYAQRTFERTLGWKSVLLVGFLFGLFHVQPLGLFSLSGLGMLFGYFYFASRSLLPGMAAHFTNNAVTVFLAYSGVTIGGVDFDRPTGVTVLLTLPLALIALYAFHRTEKGRNAELELS
jgi:membrane protease YdiL (CAAX protease family)